MASEVGIVNSAGRKIGVKNRVISLDDGSPLANLGADRYEEIRDEILRGHPWNFAMARAKLARATEEPGFEFTYKYVKPTGWVRTIGVFNNDAGTGWVDYKEEGGHILSDAEDLYLRYVQKITDPNLMTPDFRECIAIQLAEEGAISITNSKGMAEKWERKLPKALNKAKSTDAMSDRPDRRPMGSWVRYRVRSSGFDSRSGW